MISSQKEFYGNADVTSSEGGITTSRHQGEADIPSTHGDPCLIFTSLTLHSYLRRLKTRRCGEKVSECERFRTFSSCARPFGLLHPTARVSFAGSYLEGFKGQRARTSLRVAFVLDPKFCWRGHGVPWSPPVFATVADRFHLRTNIEPTTRYIGSIPQTERTHRRYNV